MLGKYDTLPPSGLQRLVPFFTTHTLLRCFNSITVLTMNRPASRNALGRDMMKQFAATLDEIRFDKETRVVVLRSTVDRVFCAGAGTNGLAPVSRARTLSFSSIATSPVSYYASPIILRPMPRPA